MRDEGDENHEMMRVDEMSPAMWAGKNDKGKGIIQPKVVCVSVHTIRYRRCG